MERNNKILTGKEAVLLLLLLASLGFLGCSSVGKMVPAEKQILFSETGKSGGTYKFGLCTVEYSYSLAGGNMTLGGSASYNARVDSLDVRVQFLDGTGTVLQQKLVYSTGYRISGSWKASGSFQERLTMPPGAAGISFTCAAQERLGNR